MAQVASNCQDCPKFTLALGLKDRINAGYTVTLFNIQTMQWEWVSIAPPTMAQRLLYARDINGYMWVSVYELANLRLRLLENAGEDSFVVYSNGSMYEAAASGEFMNSAIRRLTGSANTTRRNIVDLTDAALILKLRQQPGIERVVTVCTPATISAAARAAGLVQTHAYSVVGYNATTGRVILRNPWNNAALPGGTELQIRLQDFKMWFIELATENFVVA